MISKLVGIATLFAASTVMMGADTTLGSRPVSGDLSQNPTLMATCARVCGGQCAGRRCGTGGGRCGTGGGRCGRRCGTGGGRCGRRCGTGGGGGGRCGHRLGVSPETATGTEPSLLS